MSGELPPVGRHGPGQDTTRAGGPQTVLDLEFDGDGLYRLRAAVLAHAVAAGMPERRAADVMIAVHELAANAVRYGAGTGRARMWAGAVVLRCQVDDGGGRGGRAADEVGPWPYQRRHGLWLVREVADEMTVRSGPDGTQVTAVFALPAAGS